MLAMYRFAPSQLERFQARDLAALIDLYEANYIRLMQLTPELDAFAPGTVVSRVSGALDLYLTVHERFKYTTAISLTYRFDGDDGAVLEPFARICVYHDVRAVEVVSHCRRRRIYANRRRGWRPERMPEVNRRWELNRFLLKWLKFCTNQGHIFLTATTAPDPDTYRVVCDYPSAPPRNDDPGA